MRRRTAQLLLAFIKEINAATHLTIKCRMEEIEISGSGFIAAILAAILMYVWLG